MDNKRLLELAGVKEHVSKETTLFNSTVCPALKKLIDFCDKEEGEAYKGIKADAQALCDKLTKHLESYK
jgi:hypothetical protein